MNEDGTLPKRQRNTRAEASCTGLGQELATLLPPALDSMYGTAVRLCGNEAEAQDLVQEASLLALRHFDTFEQGSNFIAWICKILTNCYRARYRLAPSRRKVVDIEDVRELDLFLYAAAAGLISETRDMAAELLGHMDHEEVIGAIDALPEEYRIVSILYFTQELSYQEIADVLDCPVGTVRSRLHRARKALQRTLRQLAEERGILQSISE